MLGPVAGGYSPEAARAAANFSALAARALASAALRLADTRAFHEVQELRHGVVWLQATPDPSECEGVVVGRVFEALAPVLIPGLAKIRTMLGRCCTA